MSPPCAIFLLPHHKQDELGSQQPVQGSGLPRQGNLDRESMRWKPEGAPAPADGVRAAISPVHQAAGFLGDQEQVTVDFRRFAFDIMWPESFGA